MNARGLRDAARHVGAALPHGRTLPEAQWESRHRALRWLLWAHVAAIPVIALLLDQGLGQALLDCATVGVLRGASPSSGSAAGARSRWR